MTRYCPGGTFPFTLDTWENFFFGVHRADYGAMGFHVVGWAAGPGIADWVPGQEIAHVTWTSACANSSVDVFVKITDCQATTEFRINAVR